MKIILGAVVVFIVAAAVNVAIGAYRSLSREDRIISNTFILLALVVAFLLGWLSTR